MQWSIYCHECELEYVELSYQRSWEEEVEERVQMELYYFDPECDASMSGVRVTEA